MDLIFVIYFQLKYDALRKADPNCKKLSPSAKHQKYCEAASEVMSPIVASVRPLHPPKVWEDISPQFLVTFWSLTMYDLFVPNDSYQREINKIKQLSLQVMDSKDMVRFLFNFSSLNSFTKQVVVVVVLWNCIQTVLSFECQLGYWLS